jgi:hypothetical protein
MRQGVLVALLLVCLVASACGDDDGSAFAGVTTTAGGEVFATTQATTATTGSTSTSTSTTTTTTVAETTSTTAPVVLGPTCTNISMGYTISYPVGWHVDGEDVNWNDYPSDDLSCRLYGPDVFVDPGGGGQEWLIAKSAQAIVTLHSAPDPGFGVGILPRDLGYFTTAELLAYLQDPHGLTITEVGNGTMPTWKVEGWLWSSRVYGYVIQSWPGCLPLELGMSSTDEALVTTWAPTVDAMLASFVAQQMYNC